MASKIKFIRQDIHKKKRLEAKWRKPRGIDSKKRLMKNNRLIVKPGYGTKSQEHGKHFSGREIVYVSTLEELKKADTKKDIVVLSRKIGFRRKQELLEFVAKNKLKVLHTDPNKTLEKRQKEHDEKKALKDKKEESKKKSEKPAEKEDKKDSIEDVLSEEEKKKVEKQEIDRLLTKKF